MVVDRSVELCTYSIDITQQDNNKNIFPQFYFCKIHLILQRYSTCEIPQNTLFRNSAIRIPQSTFSYSKQDSEF